MADVSKNCVILILDYDSDYGLRLTNCLQDLSILCLCLNGASTTVDIIDKIVPGVIIICAGRENWPAPNTHPFRSEILKYAESHDVYVLGLAFGMHLLVQSLGGEVARVEDEYRYMITNIEVMDASIGGLFGNKSRGDKLLVSIGYGYEIVKLPKGFQVAAGQGEGSVAAVSNIRKKFYGLNFPVQLRRIADFEGTIEHFLFNVCGVSAIPNKDLWLNMMRTVIKSMLGREGHVVCAVVECTDTINAATLFHKAIGDNLHCVLVDNGLLRYKEREELTATFERDLRIPLTCVDAAEQLLWQLKGMVEGRAKGDIIAEEFIKCLNAFGHDLEEKFGKKPVYMIKGIPKFDNFLSTNVGVSPEELQFQYKKPSLNHDFVYELGNIDTDIFIRLFPTEVFKRIYFEDRSVAVYPNGFAVLNTPVPFLRGPPFLGTSGLISTVLGDMTEGKALNILRQVDEIFFHLLKNYDIGNPIWKIASYFVPEDGHLRLTVVLDSQVTNEWMEIQGLAFDVICGQMNNNYEGICKVSCRSTMKRYILGS